MKTLTTLFILLSLSASSFAQSYKIYTAKANGNFGNNSTWSVASRTDNVNQDKYFIPAGFTVTADKETNYTALGDIQVVIAGELAMGASAEMALTPNSSIQLLAGGSVDGNGGSQQILIGGVLKYKGNTNKSISGPLFADKTTSGFSLFTTLSVKFLSFTAAVHADHAVTLTWATTAEINNHYFQVEFSSNGRDWSAIGKVNASSNNSRINTYTFSHKNASAVASYRLKQVDQDGQFTYSDVVIIKNQSAAANIYAVNKTVHVEFNAANNGAVVVKVLNMNGQVIKTESFNQSGKISLNLNALKSGNYIVQASDNKNMQSVKSLMIF